jgi:hypothetical protein
LPDVRAAAAQGDGAVSAVQIGGRRAEVLAYVAEHLDYLDGVADRTHTPRPSQEQMPQDRLEHLAGLAKIVHLGAQRNGGTPSPYHLRALAAQCCAWLEELRDRGEVSW